MWHRAFAREHQATGWLALLLVACVACSQFACAEARIPNGGIWADHGIVELPSVRNTEWNILRKAYEIYTR